MRRRISVLRRLRRWAVRFIFGKRTAHLCVCIADLRSCKYNEQLLKTAKNKIPLVRLFFMSVPKIPCGFCGGKNIKTLDG